MRQNAKIMRKDDVRQKSPLPSWQFRASWHFDVLMHDGKVCRRESLLDRKLELPRVLSESGSAARISHIRRPRFRREGLGA